MESAPVFTRLELNLSDPRIPDPSPPKTPSEWFSLKFPQAASRFGCPFLEARQTDSYGLSTAFPISVNFDFMAGMLGGDSKLSHSVIYYAPEMQFYYFEPFQKLYKPTSPEKLQNYYRAMLMRCAQELRGKTDCLKLFHEFRNDGNAKKVTDRAKSILAADAEFFSVNSPHQRIRGIELHERLARKFVEGLLACESGEVLLLADAYAAFGRLLKEQSLAPMKRSEFKAMVVPLMKEQFDVCLRNDLRIDERSGVRGWKGVKFPNQALPA